MTAVPAVSKTVMYMYEHVRVEVKTGTFENETPDCLLVFLDKQGLHQYSYTNKLLELAGDEVKGKWMDHRKRDQFKKNVILVTVGGKLDCSKIIHVPCDVTTISDAAGDALMRANASKMKTIVIPLLHNETNKGDHSSVSRKNSVDSARSTTTGPIVEQISPDEPGSELKTRLQSMTETNKGDHSSVSRKKLVNSPRSAPTGPVVEQISPDEPGSELKTHLQSMTEANKGDHSSVSRKNSVDSPRSTTTGPIVEQISPDEPGSELKTRLQSMTETNKGDHSSFSKKKLVNSPRSAPTGPVVEQISPDEPGSELKTHLQSMTEANKGDHSSVSRKNSVDSARSTTTGPIVEQISPDEPGSELKTRLQSMTEANKGDHSSVSRKNSVDSARSTTTGPIVEQISPDEPGSELKTRLQSMTEANKGDHSSVSRKNSVDSARSTTTGPIVEQISPDEPGSELKTRLQSMTEANKGDHSSVSRKNSVDSARSTTTGPIVEQISPDEPGSELKTRLQSMTEAKKSYHRSVRRKKLVDPPRSAPTEQVVQKISPDEPGRELKTHLQSMTCPEVSSAEYNIQLPQTDKWKCCVIVSGDIKSKEDLEEMLSSYSHCYSIKLKHVVYPYEEKSALVIFEKEVDVKGLEHCTKPFKVEPLQPQELDFHVPDSLVGRAYNTGETETLFTNLKEISGVEVIVMGNSVYLVGVTTHQMDIAKCVLKSFRKKWHDSKKNKQSESMLSGTPDEESYSHRSTLNSMSELEFKALEIIESGFEREKGVHISWDGDAVVIYGPTILAHYAKKNLISRLGALRNKQSEEVFLDEEENKIVQDVIGEVQSKDTICVYDEKKSQVVVYSDKQDDIMKFKHKLKFRTGKVKENGRNRQRFSENDQLLEACQGDFSSEIRQEFSWSKDASDLEVFYTKENIKVAVYKANILNLPVDCIVNAANDNLQHGGGVARVIADAAGPELVRQGNATIMDKVKGKIPVGFQVTTTAGRLPYKCVIHTVGPCWSDYHPHDLQKVNKCEKDLYTAIYGCFVEAETNGLSSIALPAVSSGIYAVPQDMCAVQYARAVLDYSRNSVLGKSLKEIHFIDKIPHLVKLMQDTFRTMIKNGKVPNYNIQDYVASSSNYQRQQTRETGQKGHEKQDITANNSQYETTKLKEFSPFYYEAIVHHTKQFVFQVSAKPVVCIYKGDILKLKNMDAIVCPNDTRGFGKGSIALELEKKKKYKQQKEKGFERKNPDLGDVVIIHGKENPFDVIVHVVIENNSPQKPEFKSTIKKSIDNILRKTNERIKVKTIALPLFGVKQELLTEKSWAESFLEIFVAFCREVENPNLEEVHIITHFSSSSAYSTVKNVFRDFADEVNKTHLKEKVPPLRPPPPKVHRTSDHKQDHMSGRGHESKNDKDDLDDTCTICICPKTDPKSLSCGHSFCSECIDQMFKHKPVCPVCGKIVGTLTGDQPNDGRLYVKTASMRLAGYEGHGSIVITYDFPAGKQGPNHPSPGTYYGSMTRTAYLPDTPEGKTVCRMLQLAFERRLMFTISISRTTGQEGLTWNDIHHKTNPKPGGQFGYPDPEYLSRVKDELAAKGITEADLPPE